MIIANLVENGFPIKEIDAKEKRDVHKRAELVKRTGTTLTMQSSCFFDQFALISVSVNLAPLIKWSANFLNLNFHYFGSKFSMQF